MVVCGCSVKPRNSRVPWALLGCLCTGLRWAYARLFHPQKIEKRHVTSARLHLRWVSLWNVRGGLLCPMTSFVWYFVAEPATYTDPPRRAVGQSVRQTWVSSLPETQARGF